MDTHHYDVIIIGTGAGGGTLAHRLACSGKRILILEQGKFLPQEKENWDTAQVMRKDRYHASEIWYDKDGRAIHPDVRYWVGGNTKVYGGVLMRWREQDFGRVVHQGGISPEWEVKYRDFEPYYTQAERLYEVHGRRGIDPTEPPMAADYPFPAIRHEPRIQEIHDALESGGFHPFYAPLAIKLNEVNRRLGACIRCNTCDGFPCLVNGKADADVNCIRPTIDTFSQVTLLTEAQVFRLHTSPSGREITHLEANVAGHRSLFRADIFVVACGAINSAVLLLKSANDRHPHGLANSSNQVGRNLMKHQNGGILSVTYKLNSTQFQKTLAINDFYWGEPGFDYPMGHIQLLGKLNHDIVASEAPKFVPKLVLQELMKRSVDWLLISEDLPEPQNRVFVRHGRVYLDYTNNNRAAFERLVKRWTQVLKSIDCGKSRIPLALHFHKRLPIHGVAHQCGTCRFGSDPQTTVLDLDCRTHDIDNLYAVDGSFFPSSAAVNPTLTIIANALRVGDRLLERLK